MAYRADQGLEHQKLVHADQHAGRPGWSADWRTCQQHGGGRHAVDQGFPGCCCRAVAGSGSKVILSDNGNFPTDLYMVEGLMNLKDAGYELRIPDPEAVLDQITDEVAVVMLTEVDYRTGRRHDMQAVIEKAHRHGAVVVWDLAHSAGAVPVDVGGLDTDFAVGCTYKYLNGGPGSPAFIHVAPRLLDVVEPALSGWYAHEAPFAFDTDFRAMPGAIERMRIGTPSIAAFALLEAALDIWEDVDMADLHEKAIELSEMFIGEVEARCPGVTFAGPRNPQARGSHVSFRFEHGYACMQAMIAHQVIGDFRGARCDAFWDHTAIHRCR